MLLLHGSKTEDFNVSEFAEFVEDVDKMKVVKEINETLADWQSAARTIMSHSKVNHRTLKLSFHYEIVFTFSF